MGDLRIQKPQHVRRMLNETINAVRNDDRMDLEKKARVLAYLASVTLTSLRDGDLENRIAALETREQ